MTERKQSARVVPETPEERAEREERERVARAQQRVVYLVGVAQAQAERVRAAETALKSAKNVLAELLEGQLPEALDELDDKALALPDGTTVKIATDVKAHVSKEHSEEALKWLVDNKLGGLIKTRVTVEFGRNELAMAQRFAEVLRASVAQYPVEVIIHEDAGEAELVKKIETLLQTVVLARDIDVTATVHGSTLKAFVTKQFKTGADWPAELFGAFERRVAKIKSPKGEELGAAPAEDASE